MDLIKQNIDSNISQLNLDVIQVLHKNNTVLAISDRTKEIYYSIGSEYNNFLIENNLNVNTESIKQFLFSCTWQPTTFNLKLNGLIKIISNQPNINNNFILLAAVKESIKQSIKRATINRSITKEDFLTKQQIDDIISNTDEKTGFIIEFLFKTGCRISEMINTKLSDLEIKDTVKISIIGKGNKQRHVYIDKFIIEDIKNVFFGRVYLFETTKHTQYNRSNLFKDIKKAGRNLGHFIHPHTMRHSCANFLKEMGKSPQYIQKYLGHANVSTTLEHYFHEKPESDIVELFN